MKACERRQEILEILHDSCHATMDCLAEQFDVTRRTIINDIQRLSLTYPIYTVCGKYDGGVYIRRDFKLGKEYLTPEQENALIKLIKDSPPHEKEKLLSILKKFGRRPVKE